MEDIGNYGYTLFRTIPLGQYQIDTQGHRIDTYSSRKISCRELKTKSELHLGWISSLMQLALFLLLQRALFI